MLFLRPWRIFDLFAMIWIFRIVRILPKSCVLAMGIFSHGLTIKIIKNLHDVFKRVTGKAGTGPSHRQVIQSILAHFRFLSVYRRKCCSFEQ